MTGNRRRILLLTMAAFVAVPTVICVLSILIVARPPWVSEAQWHFDRYLYWRHEPGTPDQRERHRRALIALEATAVPVIAEYVVTCPRKHDREIAVYLLRDIGPVAHQAIDDMLADPVAQYDGGAETDRVRRLLFYAQFAAFHDRNAFGNWLSAMDEFDGDLFDETCIEDHIEEYLAPGAPEYSVRQNDRFVINPEFVEWWRFTYSEKADDAQEWKSARSVPFSFVRGALLNR